MLWQLFYIRGITIYTIFCKRYYLSYKAIIFIIYNRGYKTISCVWRQRLLFYNSILFRYWLPMLSNYVYMTFNVYSQIAVIRWFNSIINCWGDIFNIRRFFLDQYNIVNYNIFYYNRRPANIILKVVKQVRFLRRSYNSIVMRPDNNKRFSQLIGRMYNSCIGYKRGILIWLVSNYISFRISKLYNFSSAYGMGLRRWMCHLRKYIVYHNIKFNIIYLPVTKIYLYGLLNMWSALNEKGGYIHRRPKIMANYIWDWVDVPSCNEVDYFGGNSICLYRDLYSCYSYIYILFFIKWNFMNIYNWKFFY